MSLLSFEPFISDTITGLTTNKPTNTARINIILLITILKKNHLPCNVYNITDTLMCLTHIIIIIIPMVVNHEYKLSSEGRVRSHRKYIVGTTSIIVPTSKLRKEYNK